MRISELSIQNFRSIRRFDIKDIKDAIVIAGPNGCGKSSVFDAIRLLKSCYGQYRAGELQQWFSEFQIDLNQAAVNLHDIDNKKLFFDLGKPIEIYAKFYISDVEIDAIKSEAFELYKSIKLSNFLQKSSFDGNVYVANPLNKQADRDFIDNEARFLADELLHKINGNEYVAKLTMEPGKLPVIQDSPLVTLLLSVYRPAIWGIIDYHAPSRTYGRKSFNSVNLSLNSLKDNSAQHALYQTANKYTNIKQEMAASYLMELISGAAGQTAHNKSSLQNTLTELFSSFFPGKKFVGVLPTQNGTLEFPVETENGTRHDIDELSSGEKEVLLGYLKLRNSTPRNSILLLDEPELHLNPRLARSLPRFYEKHISRAMSNQIWMVTHSDAILREAVSEPGYSVFHMQPAGRTIAEENQASTVSVGADIENAIISLTGDLASYNPRSKVVLLEGENSEFDLRMISQLFPDFFDATNPISLGSSRNVQLAHRLLAQAAQGGKLDVNFYSIVDKDYFGSISATQKNSFSWDRYHIENYLVEPRYVREALLSITAGEFCEEEADVAHKLRDAAYQTIEDTVRIQITEKVNSLLVSNLSLSYDKENLSVEEGLSEAVKRSATQIRKTESEVLSKAKISEMANDVRSRLERSFQEDTWVKELRGRNILSEYVSSIDVSIQYQHLRNLIISRMKEDNFEPEGMKAVLDKIIASN